MLNECIRIGIKNNIYSLKQLSKECYKYLCNKYDILTYYILHAISKASVILRNRIQSLKRGYKTKIPYLFKNLLISSYGFKFDIQKKLFTIPMGNKKFYEIPLNNYIHKLLSNPEVEICSFTITSSGELCISYRKEIQVRNEHTTNFIGIDRNLENITVGNEDINEIKKYDLYKTVKINKTTKSIYSSFKRKDNRIRTKIYRKYGLRRKNRVNQILHNISNKIVNEDLDKSKQTAVFEDIKDIRSKYKKIACKSREFRSIMNSWCYGELKRQIQYKCNWKGLSIIEINKENTFNTSSFCYRCGKRVQYNKNTRICKCKNCNIDIDRDNNAVINIAKMGRKWFYDSKGFVNETMKQNNVELIQTNPILFG